MSRSEPTLRLDLAPSLNWLTRRSVLAAIHSNTLLIEQIHVATLFLEGTSSSYSYAGFGSGTSYLLPRIDLTLSLGSSLPTSPTQLTKVNCALCGKVVYMSPEAIQAEENKYQSTLITESPTTPTPHSHPVQNSPSVPSPQRAGSGTGGGWAARKYLKSVTLPSLGGIVAGANGSRSNSPRPRHSLESSVPNGSGPVTPTTATMERPSSPPPPTSLQTVIHAFRVPLSNKSTMGSNLNLPASAYASNDPSQPSENYGPPYPLCHTGWCLARLKTTCEMWGYVRTDVVERVWKDGEMERRRLGGGGSVGNGRCKCSYNGEGLATDWVGFSP